jgi:Na+/H+ antiporter NhaB
MLFLSVTYNILFMVEGVKVRKILFVQNLLYFLYAKLLTDFVAKQIPKFGVARHSAFLSCQWIYKYRMPAALTFKAATAGLKVLYELTSFHYATATFRLEKPSPKCNF